MDTELFLKLSDGAEAPDKVLVELDGRELMQITKAADNEPSNKAAIQEVTIASYYASRMYKKGIGTSSDIDRSAYYLRRAADFGYDRAQLEYGERMFLWHSDDKEADPGFLREGFKYIEKAADAGLVDGIKKYIELAGTFTDVNAREVAKAKEFVHLMRKQSGVSGVKKVDKLLKKLDRAEVFAKIRGWNPAEFIVGCVLFFVGVLYLFKGLNPVFFAEHLPRLGRLVPAVPDSLIIKPDKITKLTDPHMTHLGLYGCWLILIGNILYGMSVRYAVKVRKSIACEIVMFSVRASVIAICVFHFAANFLETDSLFGNGGLVQVASIVVAIAAGRAIGFVISKVLK